MNKTAIATLAVSGLAFAQETAPAPSPATPSAEAQGLQGRFGIDFTTQYFFRGIVQDKGFLVQPWVELGYDLVDADSGLRDLKLVFGQWNSLGDGPNAATSGSWYESRFYAGLVGEVGERWRFGTGYISYSFPNLVGANALGLTPVQEIAFFGAFDDKGLLSDDWSLNPSVFLAFEIDNQRDGGNDEGVYAEVGIAPEFRLTTAGESEVTLSVPTKLGVSLGDYYERAGGGGSDFFGFLQTGAVVRTPLDYLPARLGPWVGEVGLHLIVLGDNNEARNNGDTAELILTVGMSTTF